MARSSTASALRSEVPGSTGSPTWHLRGFDLFRKLPETELLALERVSQVQRLRRGAVLYGVGEASLTVYGLRRGAIKLLVRSESGREGTLALLREGEIFGELEAIDGTRRGHFATAHEDSLLYAIPRTAFVELMQSQKDFAFTVSVSLGRRIQEIQSKMLCLLFKSADSRLSQLLLELGAYCGQPTPDGTRLRYRFAHHELAGVIGVARETVTLTLREFRRAGLIASQGGHIVLREPGRLAEFR